MRFELESWYEVNRIERIYATSGTEAIVRWLRDSAVTKNICSKPAEKLLIGVRDSSANHNRGNSWTCREEDGGTPVL